MRISTSQIYTNANRNMMENQTSLLEIQSKLSSGKQFTSLAEDPVGANRVVTLNRELAQLEMYQENIDATRRRLALEETTISDLNTMMDRVRDLTIQAGNGALSDADRVAISYEIEELVDYAAGLMNTRDAKGEYLFSGSQGETQTYIQNADGRYEYQGDGTNRNVQVSSALYMESTDNGQFLFESVLQAPDLVQLGGDELAGALTSTDVTDAELFSAYMRDHGDITLTISESGGIYSYSLEDSAGVSLATNTYTPGDVVNLSLDGIDLELTLPAVPAAESDSTTLRFEQQSDNILNTMLDTVEILRQPTDGIPAQQTALEARLALTLDQVTMAQDRLSLGSASLGSRLNTLDSAELTNSDFQLMTEGTRSAVQDLDYAAAATELSKRQLALEAAYSSFAKIQGLSLFNYIR
jgi:flagellar hook-associated protein 3